MRIGILIIGIFSVLQVNTVVMAADRWPFESADGPHYVQSTMGEYRPATALTSNHIHKGVDLKLSGGVVQTGENGTKIYAIDGCNEPYLFGDNTDNEGIECGNYKYIHIETTIDDTKSVSTGDEIGVIKAIKGPHLHLGENDGAANPLRSGGLKNYADTVRTTVWKPKFFKDEKITEQFTITDTQGLLKVSGKVDILAKAKDAQSNGSSTVAPYLIGYMVKDSKDQEVNKKENIKFDSASTDDVTLDKVLSTILSNISEYHYWVTNQKNANDAWDTASLPDGEYKVSVYADDIKGEETGNHKYSIESSKGAETVTVFLDNYVNVESTTPSDSDYNVATDSNESSIVINFDRAMDIASVQSALNFNPTTSDFVITPSNENKTVTIVFKDGFTSNTDYIITVGEAAKDKDGNLLDGDDDGEPGGDYTFKFSTKIAKLKIEVQPELVEVGASKWTNGGVKTIIATLVDELGNAIESTFAPSLSWASPSGGEVEINFPDSSVPTTSWSGTINIPKGSNGNSSFSSDNMEITGDGSFIVDTTPPRLEPGSVASKTCRCPSGPIAFDYQLDDGSGSGLDQVDTVGLGLSANSCYGAGNYKYGAETITDKVGNETSLTGQISIINNKCTNPDDNYSVVVRSIEGGTVPTDTIGGKKVGILGSGYVYSSQKFLIDKVGLKTDIITPNFSPDIYEEYSLLIIPTGALSGLTQSDGFKARLNAYVEKGGTIFALSQMQGYEFGALPGGEITGYGYQNDQQCFTNAANIDNWHQVLSGQSESSLDLNIDGFYTGIPATGTSLLRRVSNGQTALTIYPYGEGHVIATTMYTDWGYSVSQYTQDEISLIRDIISWAKKPAELPEMEPGGAASVTVPVVNSTGEDVGSVKIFIRNPAGNVVKEFNVPTSIGSGDVSEVTVTYESDTTSPLGIWWVNYELLDENGNSLQAEYEGARFALATRPQTPAQEAGLSFSVLSDSENYLVGDDAIFSIVAFNNGDTERTITAKYEDQQQELIVPPHKSTTVIYEKGLTYQSERGTWLAANFYDINGEFIGSASKRYWTAEPSVKVTTNTDKSRYSKGENIDLAINLMNDWYVNIEATLSVNVTDSTNATIYSQLLDVALPAQSTLIKNMAFIPPPTVLSGNYLVIIEVYDANGNKIGLATTSYEMPKSLISIAPVSPVIFGKNSTISFEVANIGFIDVAPIYFTANLINPDGVKVWETSEQLSNIQVDESKILDFPAPSQPLLFGNYRLAYGINYNDEESSGEVVIPNTFNIDLSLDQLSYKIREEANLLISLNNTGKFNLDNLTVKVNVPAIGYVDERTIALAPEEKYQGQFVIDIPINLSPGQNDVNI